MLGDRTMFDLILGKSKQYCDHVTRRQSLTMGSSTILGGLSLPAILQLQSLAAENRAASAKSCIFIMLEGGPSHIDMWDLKPQATKEIRGLFQPISTIVPGTQISEILPLCAQITDKMAIMRSHSHRDNGHQTGRHRVLTGYPPSFGDGQAPGMPFNALYPSIGSVISRELGIQGAVPPYIEMPNPLGPGGPGFYGPTYAPFTIETDPVEPDFSVRDLSVANGIDDRRFTLRRKLLQGAERLSPNRQTSKRAKTMSTYYKKALELATSDTAKKAFHIQSEPDEVRQRYGLHSLGQCALLSRRLVEAGCRFVGIEHGSWDTHVDNFTGHAKALVPPADQALSALITHGSITMLDVITGHSANPSFSPGAVHSRELSLVPAIRTPVTLPVILTASRTCSELFTIFWESMPIKSITPHWDVLCRLSTEARSSQNCSFEMATVYSDRSL